MALGDGGQRPAQQVLVAPPRGERPQLLEDHRAALRWGLAQGGQGQIEQRQAQPGAQCRDLIDQRGAAATAQCRWRANVAQRQGVEHAFRPFLGVQGLVQAGGQGVHQRPGVAQVVVVQAADAFRGNGRG